MPRRDPRPLARRPGSATATKRSACWTQVGMAEAADRPCSELAYGDVKRVELAIALAGEPEAAADGRADRRHGAARARRADGAHARHRPTSSRIGVLFTEHDMDVVFGHAARVLVLCAARSSPAGRPDEMRANPRVRQAYLGDALRTGGDPVHRRAASRHPRTCRRAMAGRRCCSTSRFSCTPARWWR